MDTGIWMIVIILTLFIPSIIALILCLILIKKKPYKKLSKKQIYAGFWYRFLAGLLDYIILAIISVILIFIPVIGWVLNIFLYWLYFAVQQSSTKQATFGMRACDIRITDENQNKIGFWRATGNYFVSSLSALVFFIGFFMIGFTSRKQGLHNLISRTLCIKVK
jgi:uncharacterized RDD family membrane protein YckC